VVRPEDLESLVAWARGLGAALFPIPAWRKKPTGLVESFAEDWSRDPAQWRRWYADSGGCNFGLVAGPSGLILGDVDCRDGAPQWDAFFAAQANAGAPLVRSPSGGFHAYFRAPEGLRLGQPNWSKDIHIRAGRGYVVAPWSRTLEREDPSASDGAYALVQVGELRDAPPELVDHCRKEEARLRERGVSGDLGADGLPLDPAMRMQVAAEVERALVTLRGALPGQRNDALNRAAFALSQLVGGGVLDESVALCLCHAEGAALGLETLEIRATTRSGMRAGRGSPSAPAPSLYALLAASAPVAVRAAPAARVLPADAPPPEPVVERLLEEGAVTVLTGRSGAGKTTLGASLMAASAAGVRNFEFGGFGEPQSDVVMRPAAWVFVSYEGGQHVERHEAAWRIGSGIDRERREQRRTVSARGPLVSFDARRNVVVNAGQLETISRAVEESWRSCPGLPVVLAVDNISSAVQNPLDIAQAQTFMNVFKDFADKQISVLLFAHPPEHNAQKAIGSHLFVSLADTAGVLSVVRRDGTGWTQWIDFQKHRSAPNGMCLELMSRKLEKPIIGLPPDWGESERGRARALEDLRLPWIYRIRVRPESDREMTQKKVERVDAKPVRMQGAAPQGAPTPLQNIVPFPGVRPN
jgi:Bifunctional DNA primase/polymerase, N-terminal/AAA domain